MPFNDTRKPAALAGSDYVYELFALENLYQHAIANFDVAVRLALLFNLDGNFAQEFHGGHVVLGEVSAYRLRQSRLFLVLHLAHLRCFVPISLSSLGIRPVTRYW